MKKTLLLLLVVSFTISVNAKDDRKTNILVIWGDDIGIGNISAYTNGMVGYQLHRIPTMIGCSTVHTYWYLHRILLGCVLLLMAIIVFTVKVVLQMVDFYRAYKLSDNYAFKKLEQNLKMGKVLHTLYYNWLACYHCLTFDELLLQKKLILDADDRELVHKYLNYNLSEENSLMLIVLFYKVKNSSPISLATTKSILNP